jgi:hypothetical protein
MTVKARFRYTGYTAGQISRAKTNNPADGVGVVEIRSMFFNPVYVSPSAPADHPNRAFWEASPSGKIELGTVNPQAWSQFEMGKVYDLTFEEAPPEAQ